MMYTRRSGWSLPALKNHFKQYTGAEETPPSGPKRPAAVLLPLLERDHELHLILTRRAEDLLHHPGQICFPGGRYETQDQDLEQTALRETFEEIGVPAEKIDVWSALPRVETITGFTVAPYIGLLNQHSTFSLAADEVAQLLLVPFKFFLDERNMVMQSTRYQNKTLTYPVYTYQEHRIWGATARIIHSTVQLLDGIEQ